MPVVVQPPHPSPISHLTHPPILNPSLTPELTPTPISPPTTPDSSKSSISSRHETVEYKPNPWSIARINAASRGSNKDVRGQATSEDTRRKPHSRAPQGRIVDALRVQAECKPPRVHAPLKALKVVKPKSDMPKSLRVSREGQVYIQGGGGGKQGEHSQHDSTHLRASV